MATAYSYVPRGVCSRKIEFVLDDGKLKDLRFQGGCDGNLKAIGRLVEGKDAREVAALLKGNNCQQRGTSCADQLSKAIEEALASA